MAASGSAERLPRDRCRKVGLVLAEESAKNERYCRLKNFCKNSGKGVLTFLKLHLMREFMHKKEAFVIKH
tara:strand:- start:863 stop:1072 length:210 start_codon:yes stop_codon:yes gene_type:complete